MATYYWCFLSDKSLWWWIQNPNDLTWNSVLVSMWFILVSIQIYGLNFGIYKIIGVALSNTYCFGNHTLCMLESLAVSDLFSSFFLHCVPYSPHLLSKQNLSQQLALFFPHTLWKKKQVGQPWPLLTPYGHSTIIYLHKFAFCQMMELFYIACTTGMNRHFSCNFNSSCKLSLHITCILCKSTLAMLVHHWYPCP